MWVDRYQFALKPKLRDFLRVAIGAWRPSPYHCNNVGIWSPNPLAGCHGNMMTIFVLRNTDFKNNSAQSAINKEC